MNVELDALSEIVSHFNDVVKSANQQHDIEQLSTVFGEILKMPLSLETEHEQLIRADQALRVG